jgi:hypothetical protein
MATWAKVKFFWDKMLGSAGSTLSATSTAAGDYSSDYLYNMLETNIWKAADTLPAYISYDAGAGNSMSADYLAIAGHNLFSSGALLSLQYSPDGMTYMDALPPFVPSSDGVVLKGFRTRAFQVLEAGYDRQTAAPFAAICVWGVSTELDCDRRRSTLTRRKLCECKSKPRRLYGGIHTHVHRKEHVVQVR